MAVCMIAVGVCTSGITVLASGDAAVAYTPPYINHHQGGYDTNDRTLVTHAYDFSIPDVGYYAADTAVAVDNRAAGEIVDGGLKSKDGKSFSFGSAVCLGDDYGLEEGYLSFDLCLTGGRTTLGLRTSRKACSTEERGIWFVFDGSDVMTIYEPISGLETTVNFPYDLSEAQTFTVHDGLDTLTLSCGDAVIVQVSYDQEGYLAFVDADGMTLAETTQSDVYVTGYFQLTMDDVDGYIDNVKFTNVEVEQVNPTADELRVIDYSTWTATDDLERTVADAATAGSPNANRYVGVFYFLCWVGAGLRVQDNTKLYVEGGIDGVLSHLNSGKSGEAYWGEPYFGYYINTDTWVYRKHAYMLEQAGVDFIYLDVSNAEVFIDGHTALFDTWLQMRHEGIDTPQIVFFNGDTPTTFQSNMEKLFTTVYSEDNWEKYEELFFMWDGKPLVFGNQSGLTGNTKTETESKFTIRGSWAWVNQNNYWPWIQEYMYINSQGRLKNGGWGRDALGKYEALSVALGHHPTTNKGRSFVNNAQPNNGLGDYEFSSVERSGQGLGFASQFNAAMYLINRNVSASDPFVMMITGWNEWIAGCNIAPGDTTQMFCNGESKYFYVDAFNAEFSRDAEPMRNADGYGFGDNYYYQMVDYIRKFKGINETPKADHQTTVNIYDVSSFDGISQSYMDSLYDVELRNVRSYDLNNRYINNTGRNDFDYAKISQDDNNLYFLVKCTDDIIIDNGENWMNLFINVDGDASTGWEGYDYVINRSRDSYVVTVERLIDDSFESVVVGAAYYALQGEYMTIRLPKRMVGIEGICQKLIFKWADNSVQNGDPMGFMDLGDTAPDNRFGFVYLCDTVTTTEETPVMFVPGVQHTTTNGTKVPGISEAIDIQVNVNEIDVMMDFEDEASGSSVVGSGVNQYFEFLAGTPISVCKFKNTSNGKVAGLAGYTDLRTWNAVTGAYTFTVDVKMGGDRVNTVFIRGEMPGGLTPQNPANAGVTQIFNYYEWDWYAENGGRSGGSSVAGSGIGIILNENYMQLTVKKYASDGLTVASSAVLMQYPAGFEKPSNGWVTLLCRDDGENISIYLEDLLLATVTLTNPGVIYDSDGTGQQYYGSCVVKDSTGQVKLTVSNTRINSEGSQIALTTRNANMEFDNLGIAYTEITAEGDRIEEEWVATGTVEYTPSDALRTTQDLISEVPTTDYVEPPVDTEGDVTDDDVTEEAETTEGESDETSEEDVSAEDTVTTDETQAQEDVTEETDVSEETTAVADGETAAEESRAEENTASVGETSWSQGDTEAPTGGAETSAQTGSQTDTGETQGCSSVVMSGSFAVMMAATALLLVRRKKQEE